VMNGNPLPSIEGVSMYSLWSIKSVTILNKRHLLWIAQSSYLKLSWDIKDTWIYCLFNGKSPVVENGVLSKPKQVKRGPDKYWTKLSQSQYLSAEFHSAIAGMVLWGEDALPIFLYCHFFENRQAPLEADVRACVEGPKIAMLYTKLQIIMETDLS
jgi:hypothetical protein